jgi:hypothetical protein
MVLPAAGILWDLWGFSGPSCVTPSSGLADFLVFCQVEGTERERERGGEREREREYLAAHGGQSHIL